MCRYGKVALFTAIPVLPVGILHRFATPLYREELLAEISPL